MGGKKVSEMIKQDSFCSCEEEKTKLNWFCYEFALSLYSEIRSSQKKALKGNKIRDKALAGFSVFLAKKMKGIILQKIAGEIENVYFSHEMVEEYFPGLDDISVNKILDLALKAWHYQLDFCETCPTRCISDKEGYCTMFDFGPY